jgi:hypothetical protein
VSPHDVLQLLPQPKQCNDGQDNDGDGKTDLQDPGCASANHDSESPDPTITKKQCNDGQDNDGDGKTDFGTGANNDPGCASATDDTENTPPVAKPDTLTTSVDNTENYDVIKNDMDVDDDNLSLSVSSFTQPSHGQVTQDSCCPRELLYTPKTGYSGPDSFTYKATDGTADSNAATVSVDVSPPSSLP